MGLFHFARQRTVSVSKLFKSHAFWAVGQFRLSALRQRTHGSGNALPGLLCLTSYTVCRPQCALLLRTRDVRFVQLLLNET
jgi:hypothetical protein